MYPKFCFLKQISRDMSIFFRRFCMAAVVSYIFIVTKIVVSVVTKTTATCVYFIQIRHIFNNWGTDLYNTQTEAHTSTIHKYHYFMFEISVHRLWTQRFLVWGQRMKRSDVHVCHRANMVSRYLPCCRSGCLFFSVCYFWKTLALYGSPMVAFTSTHTFKAYEAVSSRTKRSCFLQHFTPRHKRLLCQHHGRRHKIPLQICVKE